MHEADRRLIVSVVCEKMREDFAESIGIAIVADALGGGGAISSTYALYQNYKVIIVLFISILILLLIRFFMLSSTFLQQAKAIYNLTKIIAQKIGHSSSPKLTRSIVSQAYDAFEPNLFD